MLTTTILTSLTFFARIAPIAKAETLPVRAISFNIRGVNDNPGEGEEHWTVRGPLFAEQVSGAVSGAPEGAATLFGMQEVHHSQLVEIKSGLGPEWEHVGVGRDDGNEGGDYSPILYQSDILDLVWNETLWLSETPEKPSLGWGANHRRTVSNAVFEHIETGQRFIASNTHLDHAFIEARIEGMRLIDELLRGVQEEFGPLAVVMTGDFNSEPEGDDAYKTVQDLGYLEDVYELSEDRRGSYDTFSGFTADTRRKRIDYIFVGPKGEDKWNVGAYEVLDNLVENVYISDHLAVVADLELKY